VGVLAQHPTLFYCPRGLVQRRSSIISILHLAKVETPVLGLIRLLLLSAIEIPHAEPSYAKIFIAIAATSVM
ncbi:hypothetical protein KIN20_010047, partial [Parelaphostrongylus tenuis]